jgi:DNA-binding LacI/PurR family transcriptional regulator
MRKSDGRGPSMATVAAQAGVSAQTVSRVLRGHPNVTAETQQRVMTAVEELGYRLNGAARALSSGRTGTIGVIEVPTANWSSAAVGHGLELAAREAGYDVTISATVSAQPEDVEAAFARLEVQGVDGVVLAVPTRSSTTGLAPFTRRIPTVSIDGSLEQGAQVVSVDQVGIGRMATEYLLDLGHPTVWHVTGEQGWVDADAREAGWQEVLRERGLEVPPALRGDWSPESGEQAGEFLARMPEVSAVFVASDEMAFGVIAALVRHGRNVPGDVSVVGVDDIPLARYAQPPLTTVAQSYKALGARAVRHLIARLDGEEDVTVGESIVPELVVRGSAAKQ